eukprot:g2685.t1
MTMTMTMAVATVIAITSSLMGLAGAQFVSTGLDDLIGSAGQSCRRDVGRTYVGGVTKEYASCRNFNCATDDDACGAGYQCAPRPGAQDSNDGVCLPCQLGQICRPGTVTTAFSVYENLCPEGKLCPDPKGFVQRCPRGTFCSAGTFMKAQGPDAPYFNTSRCLMPGMYCPSNTKPNIWWCPPGRYCPTSNEAKKCPKDHYCWLGSKEPAPCKSYVECPEGTKDKISTFVGTVVIVLCVGAIIGLFALCSLMLWIRTLFLKNKHLKKVIDVSEGALFNIVGEAGNALRSSGNYVLGVAGSEEKDVFVSRPGVSFSFNNLSLTVQAGGHTKRVLNSVSGNIEAGTLTAVMGPSGAGKTTVISDRAGYGTVSGELLINGAADSIANHRDIVGFVPQDDVVHEDLTVRENLMYAAQLRLPLLDAASRGACGCRSRDLCTGVKVYNRYVDEVLSMMQIDHVADSIVGNVEKRGISGGQRKRVNIGLEVVADPTVLFLDEPTSGLDSTSSEIIVSALKRLSKLGRTIVTVIHQPRFSIYAGMDNVIFLGPGGNSVYHGPSLSAIDYFEMLGFRCPPNENAADFFMDVIAGTVACSKAVSFEPSHLYTEWQRYCDETKKDHFEFRANSALSKHLRLSDGNSHLLPRDVKFVAGCFEHSLREGTTIDTEEEFRALERNLGLACALGHISKNQLERALAFIRTHQESGVNYDDLIGYLIGSKEDTDADAILVSALGTEEPVEKDQADDNDDDEEQEEEKKKKKEQEEEKKKVEPEEALSMSRRRFGCDHAVAQFIIFLLRYLRKKIRAIKAFTLDCVLILVSGIVIGLIVGPTTNGSLGQMTLLLNHLMICLVFGVLAVISCLDTFGADRLIFWRESSEGISIASFWFARNIVDLLFIFIRTLIYLAVVFDFTQPMTGGYEYAQIYMAVAFANSGMAYLLSIMIPQKNVTLYSGLLTVLLGAFFSGVLPVLKDLKLKFLDSNPFQFYICKISYAYYAVEALVVSELNLSPKGRVHVQGAGLLEATGFGTLDRLALNSTDIFERLENPLHALKAGELEPNLAARTIGQAWLENVLYLVILGVCFRFAALISLFIFNRQQQNKKRLCGWISFATLRKPYHYIIRISQALIHKHCGHKSHKNAKNLSKTLSKKFAAGNLLHVDSSVHFIEPWSSRLSKHGKSSAEKRAEEELRMKKLFRLWDSDHSGSLELSEISAVSENLEVKFQPKKMDEMRQMGYNSSVLENDFAGFFQKFCVEPTLESIMHATEMALIVDMKETKETEEKPHKEEQRNPLDEIDVDVVVDE